MSISSKRRAANISIDAAQAAANDFKRRVSVHNQTVREVQLAFADAVAEAWKITNDPQAQPGPMTTQTYRQKMRTLEIEGRELRQENERNGYGLNIADAIWLEAKTVWGNLMGLGIINPLRRGVINARPDAEKIAITSHDDSIGWTERTNKGAR